MTHLTKNKQTRAHPRTTLRWEHLNPAFVAKVARAASAEATSAPTASGDVAAPFDLASSVVAACIALLLVALYVTIVFHLAGPGLTLLLLALPTALGTTFRAARTTRQARGSQTTKRGPLTGNLAPRFAAADLTPIERLYADLILRALDVPPTIAASGQDQRLLVQEAGALLARYASLERQRAHLLAIPHAESSDAASLADFRDGLAAATDPALRESLEVTLNLRASYGVAVQALEPLSARIDAYQEGIRQAFLLARATLAFQTASAETLVPPPVENLQAIVLRLAAQTRAAEEAVLELRRD